MKMKHHINHNAAIKILLFGLALLLGGGLFASESMAAEHCKPSMHDYIATFDVHSTLCNACSNAQHANNNCRNQCSLPIELPKIAAVSNGGVPSDSFLFAAAHVKIKDWIPDSGRNSHVISTELSFKPLHIFLQNESFLI